MSGFDVEAASDGEAIKRALFRTGDGGNFALCQGEREIAVIEVNDNSFLFNYDGTAALPRPVSIRSFELLFIAALVVGIAHVLVGWSGLSMALPDSFRTIFAALVVLTNVLFIALCFLISRRRSVVALWALVGIFAAGAIIMLHNALDGRLAGLTPISVVPFCAELIALSLLFTPASRRWMRRSA